MSRVATQRRARTGTAVEAEGHSKIQADLGERERNRSWRTNPSSAPAPGAHPSPPLTSSSASILFLLQGTERWVLALGPRSLSSTEGGPAPPGRAPLISLTQRPTPLSSPNSHAPGDSRRGVYGDIKSQAGFPNDMSSLSCRSYHINTTAV